jgi:Tfp pilus assembly protein PilP
MAQSHTTLTPASVARGATEHADITPGRLVLLGVFGTGDALQALIRLPDGRVTRVSPGDRVGHETVYAIDETRIALGRNGRAKWVDIPGG